MRAACIALSLSDAYHDDLAVCVRLIAPGQGPLTP